MTSLELLSSAGKNYSSCAKIVQARIPAGRTPDAIESEKLIALGIASEWTRRAAALKPLEYEGKLLNKRDLTPAVTEVVRFNMAWSALNALFARDSIRHAIGARRSGAEFDLFRSVYAKACIPASDEDKYTHILNTLLDVRLKTSMPGIAAGTEVTTLRALHEKFTPAEYRGRGIGRRVDAIITADIGSDLSLPQLLYLTRNWIVHGGVVPSNFRSVPRFTSYINTTVLALAATHDGVARELSGSI